ncbi:hypothetical protein ACFFRR_000740 [Megaselia abdita]
MTLLNAPSMSRKVGKVNYLPFAFLNAAYNLIEVRFRHALDDPGLLLRFNLAMDAMISSHEGGRISSNFSMPMNSLVFPLKVYRRCFVQGAPRNTLAIYQKCTNSQNLMS